MSTALRTAVVAALLAGCYALPLHYPDGTVSRSLQESDDEESSCADEVDHSIGRGCYYMTNCTSCTSKCIATDLDFKGLEAETMSHMEQRGKEEDKNHVCFRIREKIDGSEATDAKGCPSDAVIDAADASFWLDLQDDIDKDQDSHYRYKSPPGERPAVSSPTAVKAFLAEYCITAVSPGDGRLNCHSKVMVEEYWPISEKMLASEDCSGFHNGGYNCVFMPHQVNKTCAILGAAYGGFDEVVGTYVHEKVMELQAACEKQTTEADCHAYDGSALVKLLNETTSETIKAATAVAGTSSALSQARLFVYNVAAVMASVVIFLN